MNRKNIGNPPWSLVGVRAVFEGLDGLYDRVTVLEDDLRGGYKVKSLIDHKAYYTSYEHRRKGLPPGEHWVRAPKGAGTPVPGGQVDT